LRKKLSGLPPLIKRIKQSLPQVPVTGAHASLSIASRNKPVPLKIAAGMEPVLLHLKTR
jgi:hypothetical protein